MKTLVKYYGLVALLAGAALFFSNCDDPTEAEYDGVWEVVPTPKCAAGVTDIYFVSPNDGWAVAGWGYVWHYDGNSWKNVHKFKTPAPRNDVAGVSLWFNSKDEGWCAGYEVTPSREYNTRIWRYRGGAWAEVEGPDVGWVSTLWFNSPTDGWIIGGDYALRYDGDKWYKTDFPTLFWSDCFFRNSNDGWATSLHSIWRWDGTAWTRVKTVDNWFECIGFASAGNGWAMGWPEEYSGEPAVYHYDGKGWANYKGHWRAADDFYDVEFLNPDYGWAVGLDTYFWDGEEWSRYEAPEDKVGSSTTYCVECINENDVWVGASEGRILHFKGFN